MEEARETKLAPVQSEKFTLQVALLQEQFVKENESEIASRRSSFDSKNFLEIQKEEVQPHQKLCS